MTALDEAIMNRPDTSKIVFYATAVLVVLGLVFAAGLHAGARQTLPYQAVKFVVNQVSEIWEERQTVLKTKPEHFLQPARYDGSGVTVNDVRDGDDDLIFLAGFFEDSNEMRLIRRNGDVVHRWPVSYFELFPDRDYFRTLPKSDWNVATHGALALPDGSVVVIFDYAGLAKVDKCGEVVWTLEHPAHHSLQRSETGGFWVPGRELIEVGDQPHAPFLEPPYYGETLLKVSDDGKIEETISMTEVFVKNDLLSVLTTTGSTSLSPLRRKYNEIGHLNKIEELPARLADDFPLFEEGDLLISMRDYNLVFVMDPDSHEIKWWQIGPWVRQHDPDYQEGGTITIFDNRRDTSDGAFLGGSHIVRVEPVTRRYEVIFGAEEAQQMYTEIRGLHAMRPNGGVLAVESQRGRIIEADATGRIVWEYINRYDDDEIAILTEAIVYEDEYFNVSNWDCE